MQKDITLELERLNNLMKEGVIDEKEFKKQKKKILGKKKSSGWKRLLLLVGIPLVASLLNTGEPMGGGIATSQVEQEEGFVQDRVEMCIYSQKEIPALLKSPTSASFPDCSNERRDGTQIVMEDNSNYVYQGYVDADNSFGAKMRNVYFCKIKYLVYPNYAIKCEVSEASRLEDVGKQNLIGIFERIGADTSKM